MSWRLKDLETSLLIGSTLVEGSSLTESEAKIVFRGKTLAGHPVSEIRELLNYRSAVEWLIKNLKSTPFLSVDLIFNFHRRLFQGFPGTHGVFKSRENFTFLSSGEKHFYKRPHEVKGMMLRWVSDFNEDLDKSCVVPALAADLYYRFQEIHPFEDGNGRIGRILIAYWAHWKRRWAFEFRLQDKIEHLEALENANIGNFKTLEVFFKKHLKKAKK